MQVVRANSRRNHCCHVGVAVGSGTGVGVAVGSGSSVAVAVGRTSAIAACTVAPISGVGVGTGVGLGNSVCKTARIVASVSLSSLIRASTVASMSGVTVGGAGVGVAGAEQAATPIKTKADIKTITENAIRTIHLGCKHPPASHQRTPPTTHHAPTPPHSS